MNIYIKHGTDRYTLFKLEKINNVYKWISKAFKEVTPSIITEEEIRAKQSLENKQSIIDDIHFEGSYFYIDFKEEHLEHAVYI